MIFALMITVILPYLNASQTLGKAIDSILAQTYTSFELRLIDNGSTDGSTAIANEKAVNDGRIALLSEKRKGIAHALNRGLQNIRTRYVARMDADDFSNPYRFEKQLAVLESRPEIALVGSQVYGDENHTEGLTSYISWSNQICTPTAIRLNRFVESPIVHPTFMFRKELLFDGQPLYRQGAFPEDYELLLRLQENGHNMAKIEEPLLYWNDSPSRLTRTDSRLSKEAFQKVKCYYLAERLKDKVEMPIWVWGAGRASRKNLVPLLEQDIVIEGYFDVKENKTTVLPCLHFSKLPKAGNIFVLANVSNRGARTKIKRYLQRQGYEEGFDFLLIA